MNTEVKIETLEDALSYLESFDKVEKSKNSKGEVSEDVNGGEAEKITNAQLQSMIKGLTCAMQDLKKSVDEKFEKAEKKDITEVLEKKKKLEKAEEPEDDDDDDDDDDEDADELNTPVEKSSAKKLQRLLKSLTEKVEALEESNEELQKSLNEPVGRRSVDKVKPLKKSFGEDSDDNGGSAPQMRQLRKSEISKILFDEYEEGNFENEALEKAITTYEVTSDLPPVAREVLKKKGINL
jgi:hypothetical protein